MEHVKAICKTQDCGGMCMRCNLFICSVCGLLEGALTTDCPGVEAFRDHSDAVYDGQEDFKGGAWVPECSPCSPAFYRLSRTTKD